MYYLQLKFFLENRAFKKYLNKRKKQNSFSLQKNFLLKEVIIMNNNYINRFTTGRVSLYNPSLLRPNSNSRFENSRPKYGTTVIISKDDNETLDKIRSAIDNVIQQNDLSDLDNIKLPLKDGDKEYPSNRLFENAMYLYASTFLKPKIVDHKVKEILFRTDEFNSGAYSKLSLEPVYHNIKGEQVISFELINVQILPGNKLLDLRSKPEYDFQVEEE